MLGEAGRGGDSEDKHTSNTLLNTPPTHTPSPRAQETTAHLLTSKPLFVDVCLHPHTAWGGETLLEAIQELVLSKITEKSKDHLVNSRVALDVHQLRHADGARLAHAAQVVPDEINDHKVFGHVFLSLCQVGG